MSERENNPDESVSGPWTGKEPAPAAERVYFQDAFGRTVRADMTDERDDINAKLATDVMGWVRDGMDDWCVCDGDPLDATVTRIFKARGDWNPMGDIAHAMELDAAMAERGFRLSLNRAATGFGAFYVRDGDLVGGLQAAPTPAEAICRACLAALEAS